MKLLLEMMILFPLFGALLNLLLRKHVPRKASETFACGSVWLSFAATLAAFISYHEPVTVEVASWLSDFDFNAALTLYLDPLSLSLCLMITFVCGLIHLYAVPYMSKDPCYVRFFALLNLFVAAMLTLVLAENLPLLYLGWEGVGFCSYGLIGFWYREEINATAGRKAFIVNRIGDTALVIAIVWLFELCGTESIPLLNGMGEKLAPEVVTMLGFLFLAGAMGKSAQLPLSVWLPDAMTGPTPVSALIHAATMVTAGVYLLMRMFPLISGSPEVLAAIAVTGSLTAFYGATCAVAQRDLKRVLAYSTISQIGFMVLGVGTGGIVPSTFHLIVHAFFKALLFLGAGCVISATGHEQDIYRMGGLRRTLPRTFWPFLAGSLCLAGVPLTGGFFSKDAILEAVWRHGGAFYGSLYCLGLATAMLTAFYSIRMVLLVFGGETAHPATSDHHREEGRLPVPHLMEWLLMPLALLGMIGGILNLPAYLGDGLLSGFMKPLAVTAATHLPHSTEIALQGIAAIVSLWGISLAVFRYGSKRRAARIAESDGQPAPLAAFLLNGWYLDKLYGSLIVGPFKRIAVVLWERVDEGAIDKSFDAFAALLGRTGQWLGARGDGRVSAYILSMAVGAALAIAYMAWVSA